MTTKEQFASLWAQLGTVEGPCCRAMMGEYVLYYEGRVIGGIYDGRVLVKDLPAARRLLPQAEYRLPYPGAKLMLHLPLPAEPAWLAALFAALAAEVPPARKKK